MARVVTIGEKISPITFDFGKDVELDIKAETERVFKNYEKYIEKIRLNETLAEIWKLVSYADKYINENKPWSIVDEKALKYVIINAGYVIGTIANLLQPFLPETAERILKQVNFSGNELVISKKEQLFPRLK